MVATLTLPKGAIKQLNFDENGRMPYADDEDVNPPANDDEEDIDPALIAKLEVIKA